MESQGQCMPNFSKNLYSGVNYGLSMFSWAMKKSLSHLSLYRIVIIIVVVIISFYTHMKGIVLTASHEAPRASVTWFSVSTALSSGTIFTQFYLHKDDNQSFTSKHRAVLQRKGRCEAIYTVRMCTGRKPWYWQENSSKVQFVKYS